MKIGIIKEKKEGLLISSIIFAICLIIPFLTSLDVESKIAIFVLLVIACLIVLLCFAISMEWYILNEDSITVKNIFGIVNKVYYKDVKYTYVKKIRVFTRDFKGIPFILFNDGRKESSFFRGYNVDNHKKYMVRIPYVQEVVDYFKKNNIKFNNEVFNYLINGKDLKK